MIIKFGKATIAQAADSPDVLLKELPHVQLAAGMQKRLAAKIGQFDPIRLNPDRFLYIRNRSISAEESWGPNCLFQKDALIYTDDGPKKIIDIKVGDKVLTHRGVFQKVTQLFTRKASEKISIRIGHRGFQGVLQFTPEHPILVNDIWVPAGSLKAGDKLQALGSTCETCGNPILDGWRFCSRTCTSKWKMANPVVREKIVTGLRRVGATSEFRKLISAKSKAAWARYPLRRKKQSKLFKDLQASGVMSAWQQDDEKSSKAYKKRSDTMKTLCNSDKMMGWRETNSKRFRDLNYDKSFQKKRRAGVLRAIKDGKYVSSSPTDIEKILMDSLAERSIKFKSQYPIFTRARPCIVDIAFPDVKLAVECDGEYWHSMADVQQRDKYRDKAIRKKGWDVIRFKGAEIKADPGRCVNKIQRVLMNHSGSYTFGTVNVLSVTKYSYKRGPVPVYNLEVENDNSFLVASPRKCRLLWVVVHNCNYDAWPSMELQTGHPTFAGAMLDIDHDPSLPIGQVLDSYMIPKAVAKRPDDDKEGSKSATLMPFTGYDKLEAGDQIIGDWVENVWAIEKQAIETFYPGAVEAIRDGEITDTSMGCEISFSACSVCNNKAAEPTEYCQHIGLWGVNKGSVWPHPVLGHDVVSYEKCYGVRFFEDSLIMPEKWNQYPGSQGADVSAKILEIFAGKGRADVQARRLAGQLRLMYLRMADDKREVFLDLLKSLT